MLVEVETTQHFHPKELARVSDASQDELSTSAGGSDTEETGFQDNSTQIEGQMQQNVEKSIRMQATSPEQAVSLYSQHFANQTQQSELSSFNNASLPWATNVENRVLSSVLLEEDVKLAFAKELEEPTLEKVEIHRKRCRFQDTSPLSDLKAEDSDGEVLDLCQKCGLPLGDILYDHPGGKCDGRRLHGECMAQVLVDEMHEDEQAKRTKDHQEKQVRREAYGLGWKSEFIPRNADAASKLAMRTIPQGMVCLVLGDDMETVRVASTLDPATALNLEYLSTALQVRRKEGHEPIFSLDPIEPASEECEKHKMQAKVFAPEWLAGTPVGDVLFQADYHLKELSMGEHDQPVVGMKSCFDFSAEGRLQEWSAREWFFVRKAEMQITANNGLIPFVKMGVEAREQVLIGTSLEDKQISRPDHPMVRYAEAFTRNFDLIAERKSVIFHLRELAKASVTAKFLLDSRISLQEAWFHLFDVNEIPCNLEVPQLWNERLQGKVLVEEGSISRRTLTGDAKGSQIHSVYGGVNFGLSKFPLLNRLSRAPPMMSSPGAPPMMSSHRPASLGTATGRLTAAGVTTKPAVVPTSAAAVPLLAEKIQTKSTTPASSLTKLSPLPLSRQLPATASSQLQSASFGAPGMASSFGPPMASMSAVAAVSKPRLSIGTFSTALAPGRLSAQIASPSPAIDIRPVLAPLPKEASQLQGVDLRLDNFDLSEAKAISAEEYGGAWTSPIESLDECVSMGAFFWSNLDDDSKKLLPDSDRTLLRSVFNPVLSDRRADGDAFCPPDARLSYVTKLHALVKEEDSIRQRREMYFFSPEFVMTDPGELFPSSWAASVSAFASNHLPIRDLANREQRVLRPDYKEHAGDLVDTVMKTSLPVFDRVTEEGTRFRIYRVGSLEVRTSQIVNSVEQIGAVFSVRDPAKTSKTELTIDHGEAVQTNEKIAKVTEYVERCTGEKGTAKSNRRYYLVVETGAGRRISTERLSDGTVTWDEDPVGLDDRNACARVLRSSHGRADMVVEDVKAYRSSVAKGASQAGHASPSICKRYASTAFVRVAGSASKQSGGAPWWMKVAKENLEEGGRE